MPKHWSQEENDLIRYFYPKYGAIATSQKTGRSRRAVINKAHELGIKSDFKFNPEANYKRGHLRGKKRPEHSKLMKKNSYFSKGLITARDIEKRDAAIRAYKGPRYSHGIGSHVTVDGGKRIFMRSTWEVTYVFYLEFLKQKGKILKWEYEPQTFWFEKIKRGVRSYLPDFRITNIDGSTEYHEVKGWMDARSKTKIKRMAKYYPLTKLVIIDKIAFKEIKKWEKLFGSSVKNILHEISSKNNQ